MTKEELEAYRAALKAARLRYDKSTYRLAQIESEASTLKADMAGLRRTITALAPMCSEDPYLDRLGITDSVMEVMSDTPFEMSTGTVVNWLETMGFDLGAQKNAAASVHSVLGRLAKRGKIVKVEEGDKITWRGPKYDPEASDIPF